MTRYILLTAALIGAAVLFSLCSDGPATTAVAPKPLQVVMEDFQAIKCVRDSVCAEINLSYPVLSGGSDSTVISRLNDSIQMAVYLAANADPERALKPALDAAAADLFDLLSGDIAANPGMGMSYVYELKSKVLMQTNRFLSLQMDGYSYTGGAHGNYYTVVNTFDLSTAESIHLTALIADTMALRALLETAFVAAHKDDLPNGTLQDMLLDPEAPLALPVNYCVVPAGIRFVYNPYEVAAYAVGITDFTITWDQLGALAKKEDWVE